MLIALLAGLFRAQRCVTLQLPRVRESRGALRLRKSVMHSTTSACIAGLPGARLQRRG